MPERLATARHEAAHVVVGLHLGGRIDFVYTRPFRTSDGRRFSGTTRWKRLPRSRFARAQHDLAGVIAEAEISGTSSLAAKRRVVRRARDDFRSALALAPKAGRDAWLQRAWNAARDVLTAKRAEWDGLANRFEQVGGGSEESIRLALRLMRREHGKRS